MPIPPLFALGFEGVVSVLGLLVGGIAAYFQYLQLVREKNAAGEPAPAGGRLQPPVGRAAVRTGPPAWVIPTVIVGGGILFCGGCFGVLVRDTAAPDPDRGVKDEKLDKEKDKGGGRAGAGPAGTPAPVDPLAPVLAGTFDGVQYKLTSCEVEDDRVRLQVGVSNPGADRTHSISERCVLTGDVGGEVGRSTRRSGQNTADSYYPLHLKLIQGVPRDFQIEFKGIDRRATRFALVMPITNTSGRGELVFKNITADKSRAEAPAGPEPEPKGGTTTPAPKKSSPPPAKEEFGQITLTSAKAILKGVEAWVEVDGKRVADWKVGTTQVTVRVTAGTHAVRVLSVYQKTQQVIFDQQVVITADERKTLTVR
ncbi:MAG TPA: hypothetical protein VD866_19925 [Urbifossiella sp.]|nr:hypothetical protein [Urbifossiella sp.]